MDRTIYLISRTGMHGGNMVIRVCLVAYITPYPVQAPTGQFYPYLVTYTGSYAANTVLKASLACISLFGQILHIRLYTFPSAPAL